MNITLKCISKREQGSGIFVEFVALKDEKGDQVSKAIAGRSARCSFQVCITPEAAALVDVGKTIDVFFPQK